MIVLAFLIKIFPEEGQYLKLNYSIHKICEKI